MTLNELLQRGNADDPAIGSTEGAGPMTYRALGELCREVGAGLNAHGIGANDRVAIVLPNGPAMATCFVAVAAAATAAPLNPAYKEAEFEFYLSDLRASAMIVAAGVETPALAAAARLGVPIIELAPEVEPAGNFVLDFSALPDRAVEAAITTNDIALVLHTSGTTSRPKIVPLSQANLCASAAHIRATLALEADDHCLNVMPLFHIHGLIAAVLASLYAGARVSCSPGFNAMRVFNWMSALAPSWYTAVPTMHQAILERAARNADVVAALDLRFIRSSSSSLPPQVMQQLEQTFGCPVIESYGMTEAAHQMTSNALPPGLHKPGSVGAPAGPEVRLMDPHGTFVAQGGEGEIVIRGPNVTRGYEANEAANATAYTPDPDGGGDWFRTGDQGIFDTDGFLSISGRLKEIINRGGEKIAPREVDDVLMDHDAVAQVVTFAMPHPKLGEDVAAAVVLRDGASVEERALRDFAGTRLAAFKVPRKIVFLDEIPKGSTGKLQRIGLAEKLGLA